MPILVILAVVAILAFLYFQFFAPGKGRRCKWRRARDSNTRPHLARWQCDDCHVEAYSSDGRPPKECKRVLRSGL